jgi:tetratricopeptide (TPR) repeat protein
MGSTTRERLGRVPRKLVLDLPLTAVIFLCLMGVDSETSYTWRLDVDMGKVMPESHFPQPPPAQLGTITTEQAKKAAMAEEMDQARVQEAVMDILLSTVTHPDGSWKKTGERVCNNCERPAVATVAAKNRNNRGVLEDGGSAAGDRYDGEEDDEKGVDNFKGEMLDCGKAVNFTYYDHLVGIQNRNSHPKMPEPEVALTFKTKKTTKKGGEVNIDAIERRLKKSKREKPKSVELYNQIGNFWRIKGDTQKSIECFRRALAVSPNNADILLNLARVLFNLQYLDDAIFLTRRSLEVQPPDQNAWLQHFQLGEILKAYCHYQEAALHLRHVLELKPNYAPAIAALQDMEAIPDSSVHVYTILIIVFLVLGVLFWIVTTLDVSGSGSDEANGDAGGGGSGLGSSKRLGGFNRMRFNYRHGGKR